ncbi:2-nitropropane dioxygenase [Xylaria nigripes]|nr:2-nitropropane dioxygenase [Xylaria nigripes]
MTTPLTQQLGIQHRVLLAGMGRTPTAALVATVSNAGGLGVIGGVGYTPSQTTGNNRGPEITAALPLAPFRRRPHDPQGTLDELIDVTIEGGAKGFVSAVGDMNMVGHPKHVKKACNIGADLISAQGGEVGGHTGAILFRILVSACADICERFVPARESGAPESHKKIVLDAGFNDVVCSLVWNGRPLRAHKTPYVANWEANRQDEIKELTSKGILPLEHELDHLHAEGKLTDEIMDQAQIAGSCNRPMGLVAGLNLNKSDQTAKEIVGEIVTQAAALLGSAGGYVSAKPRL